MDVFVARQPIFDRSLNTYGYELLFRSGLENRYDGTDGDEATQRVIAAWLFSIGMERLTAGKRAFINFTRNLLLENPGSYLDPEVAVIEVLETVCGDAEIVAACRDLKVRGFSIALDDYDEASNQQCLVDFADIIKIDFVAHSPESRAELAERYRSPRIRLLAEKVETMEEFEEAKRLGFKFFQGHFLSVPEVLTGRQLPVSRLRYLQVMREVNQPEVSYDGLAEIVHRDASLTYRLLRYINSSAFGWRTRVHSIQHALVLLGEREIRRWATLAAIDGLAEYRPQELVTSSVVRGRLCETLAERLGLADRALDLFFLGVLSRLDVIVGRPMEEVLESIDLAEDVREALMGGGGHGPMRGVLDAVIAYEEADWRSVGEWSIAHQISNGIMSSLYLDAVAWAEDLQRTDT